MLKYLFLFLFFPLSAMASEYSLSYETKIENSKCTNPREYQLLSQKKTSDEIKIIKKAEKLRPKKCTLYYFNLSLKNALAISEEQKNAVKSLDFFKDLNDFPSWEFSLLDDGAVIKDQNTIFPDQPKDLFWFIPLKESVKVSKEKYIETLVVILKVYDTTLERVKGEKSFKITKDDKEIISLSFDNENKKILKEDKKAQSLHLNYNDLLPRLENK